MFENTSEMDFTQTNSQLQNTTFLTNVFVTTFLASLGLEGIKTILGKIFSQFISAVAVNKPNEIKIKSFDVKIYF